MNAGFTPGPWEFLEEGRTESDENANRPLTICDACNHDDLAQVFSADDSSIKVPREEAIANARLIAAAPEMYEALRDVAAHFEGTDAPIGIRAREIIAKVQL